MTDNMQFVQKLSAGLAEAVEVGALFTAMVDGRHGYAGSGVFYGQKYVLSSNHAVHLDDEIRVGDHEGKTFEATVVGRDPVHDLVLLELNEERNNESAVSERSQKVGELVLALARPSEDGVQSSLGVIGVANGTYIGGHGPALKGMIRSDVEQFPGFSGGPLVDVEGKLVGINIMGRRHGSFLTLPAEKAFAIAEKIIKNGDIRQAYLGIRSQPVEVSSDAENQQKCGLLVANVENGSPASLAKVITGDILIGIDDVAVSSPAQLLDVLAEKTEGDDVELKLVRGGKATALKATLGGREFDFHHKRGGPRAIQHHGGGHHGRHGGRKHKHGR